MISLLRAVCARFRPVVPVLFSMLLLGLIPQSIHAEGRGDVAVASTVRVVQHLNSYTAPYGYGTGVFVTPDRVLTNAHVVRDLRNNSEIGLYYADTQPSYEVVPAVGGPPLTARVIAVDEKNDLALLSVEGGSFHPVLFSGARVSQNMTVNAAGYPSNVARAFSQDNLAAARKPAAPVRTAGVIGSIQGDEYTTDASIGRGYSGGPLLDECGRVIGINRAVTINNQGDANSAITIAMPTVLRFLRDNGVSPNIIATPCPTEIQLSTRLAELRTEGEKVSEAQSQARQENREEAWRRYDQCRDDARQRTLMIGAILLVLGLAAAIAAVNRRHGGQTKQATQLTIVAVVILGALAYLALRPTGCSRENGDERAAAASKSALPAEGPLSCRFLPERSLNPYLEGEDTRITLSAGGCVNQNRVYWRDGTSLKYASLGKDDQSLSLNEINLATGQFRKARFAPDANSYAALKNTLADQKDASCTGSGAAQDAARERYRTIAAAASTVPSEILVWNCSQ